MSYLLAHTAPRMSTTPASTGSTITPAMKIAVVLLLVATGLGLYLLRASMSASPLAGCGTASGCHDVLSGRWAFWLGVPVSAPAMGVYLALLATSILWSRTVG